MKKVNEVFNILYLIGWLILFFDVAIDYMFHQIEPTNMRVLMLVIGTLLIKFERLEKNIS